MTPLSSLWLPIVLSAVIVFVASSVIHMASPWHKTDYPRLPDEDAFRNAVRPLAIPPGDYMVPRPAGSAEMRSPEFEAKLREGPNAILTIMRPGPMSMGGSLARWFVYLLFVGLLAAYVASRAVQPGGDYLAVFRFAGVTAFTAYSVALWQMSIWYHRSTSATVKATVDGLIYAALTAGTFGWLWP